MYRNRFYQAEKGSPEWAANEYAYDELFYAYRDGGVFPVDKKTMWDAMELKRIHFLNNHELSRRNLDLRPPAGSP